MSAQGAKKRMGSHRQLKQKSPDVDELQFKETPVQECGGSTESAEDVLELSKNRKKLGSRRKNNRQHHAKDLGVLDGAARNTTEDDQLGTTRMSLTDEVKVTHQVPEESHRHAELKRQRDQNNETFMNIESEDAEMSCAAEIRTDLAPGEEVEFSCSQVEGAVQTFDLTEVCDKELNVKPVETEDNPRNEGLQVTQPVSQSNLEHREAEASSAGTEEALEPTHLFVATGTVEKESELMCEDEFVLCEAPEGLLSGSPSQDQNPKPRHPEPDPQPLIPKNETPPEDLDDREADTRVELCDNSEEDDGGLDKPGPEVKGFSSSENVAKVNTEDQIESAEMHNIRVSPESVSCDAEPGSSPHQQHVHPATTDQSEASDTGDKESDAVDQVCEVDDQIEDDVKSSSDQLHQEHKDLLSEMEQSCSSQALHSETDSCSDPQPQTSDLNVSPLGNRRKLGSSRRQKGRQRALDPEPGSYKLPEAAITNSSDEETVETRKISITLETEVRGGVDENPGDGAFAFLAAEQQKDQPESTEASQEGPDRSSNTRNKTDEDAETLRIEGSYFLNESHMKWKETKCSGAAEITSESQTDAERSTEETQLGDTDGGCLHTFDVTEVDGEKETMTQEKHERENSNEALQPDAGCCWSSEAQDGFIKNDEEADTNMKPVETQDNPRNEGLQEVTQPVSQSNLEHREAEASSAGTEEALEPTHLFVATGTVEKESELMCEDEFVLCEAPEGLLSGSPSQDQNPKPRHPEPDPRPLIPKNETPPEDLDDREADSRVELCDNSEEDDGGLDKPGPEVKGFSSSENVAKVNTEDQIESAEMHNIRVSPESVSCDAEPGSSPHQQHVHPATTDQSEASDTGDKESDAVDQVCEVDDQIEDDVKSSSDQLHQEHKDLLSEMEQSCSSQALHSETDSCSEPQPQTSDLNVSLLGNRRKLGSSRRQKGRQRALDPEPGSYKLPEAAITNSSDEETVETRKISITLETEVRGGVDKNPGDGAFAFLAAEQQKDQPESTEASQEGPDRSSNTRNKTDEDAETLRIEGSYFLNESHMKWKETKCSGAAEITSESQTDAERSTEETQLGDTDRGCLHTFDVTEVDGEKETMTQEKHERENSNEALQPDAGCCWSSEAQDGFIKNDEEADTNMKPVETEDNPRNEGLQEVTQPVSQSNPEHREAEASSAGTEEALEPTHLFVATGTVEKESELMCEDEFVLCEAPEGLLSGSPSQDQNPKPRHPEPDPRPLIPKNETPPEDLDDREADTDDQDEAMTLKQEMEEMSSNDCVLSFVPRPEAGITLDSDLQEDVATAEDLVLNPIGNRRKLASSRRHKGRQHVKDTWKETFNEPKEETIETTTDEVVVELITASATMRTTASYKFQPETEPELHPAQNPGVREDKSFQEDIDLSQNVKDNDQTVTGSDSDIQRMTFQENSAGALVTLEGFTQEAPHLVQKDEDSIGNIHVRHTNDPKETGGHPGGEESADGQQELVQSSDTSTQQDPEISSSSEPTNAKDTSSDPSSLLCFQETISDDPAMEASAGHEPESHLDDRLHSQEKSKQTRRKMGSTRWTHKKQEDEHVHRAETSELRDNTQAGGGRFEVSPDKNTVSSVELPQEEADVTSDLQRTHSNLISHTDGLTACVPGQSASDSQGVFNPTINVQAADLWDGDGNIDVNVEPSQLDGFTAPEAHTAGCLVNPSQRSPIGDAVNTRSFESNLVGEESVNSITEIQQPETITSEVGGRAEDPGKVAEGGCIKHLEPADTGSDLNTAGRRRKMGSMRRNLNSGRKEEDVRQQQKVDNEPADEVSEDSVSEHSQEAAKDTRPLEPAPHPTSEEDPADQSAHQPVTSPDSDLMSGTLLSGRRRKLGSHRMSSRPPNQEAQTGGDDKLSEVDDNEMESSTNISSSTPGRHSNPVSDLGSTPRTTESPPGRRLSQDSRSSISLAGSSGDGGVNSNSYNVVMVGNSSVGKTSFMRRVQNGRFSSDLPSSVGLDTCPWPVTVDGRRVVLQLWDTAGQERFHSITRQIFHKAHAFLLMYDITSSWSFTAVSYWANCIQEEAAENVTILLLGNKSDCAERQVPTQKGEILAKEYNFEFMECSVATGQNVNESLQTLARILSNKVKLGEETTVLHKEPQQKKSSGCC